MRLSPPCVVAYEHLRKRKRVSGKLPHASFDERYNCKERHTRPAALVGMVCTWNFEPRGR